MRYTLRFIILLSLASLIRGGLDCDFDEGSCAWSNVDDADHNWLRNKGRTIIDGTGPNGDHTTAHRGPGSKEGLGTYRPGTGYYMYVRSTRMYKPKLKGDRAILQSTPQEWLDGLDVICMQFYCYMYGEDVGSLRVTYQDAVSTLSLWEMEGDQGKKWIRGLAEVERKNNHSFTMSFVVTLAGGGRGDIAIDDVSMMWTSCPTGPSPSTWVAPVIIASIVLLICFCFCFRIWLSDKCQKAAPAHSTINRNTSNIATVEVQHNNYNNMTTTINTWTAISGTRSPPGGVSIGPTHPQTDPPSYSNATFITHKNDGNAPINESSPPPPAYETVVQ